MDKRVEVAKLMQMADQKERDRKFMLEMSEDVWLKVKGYPIPDS